MKEFGVKVKLTLTPWFCHELTGWTLLDCLFVCLFNSIFKMGSYCSVLSFWVGRLFKSVCSESWILLLFFSPVTHYLAPRGVP